MYGLPLNDEQDDVLLDIANRMFRSQVPELLNDDFYILRTGTFYYPAEGWMGWHTNKETSGWTIYITYSAEGGKSFFRYYNKESDTVHTSYDKKGFTCRIFNLHEDSDKQFKHCIYGGDGRWSLGFQVPSYDFKKQSSIKTLSSTPFFAAKELT